MQGTDDLEEAMSERLQELPPPLGHRNRQSGDDFSFPQDMDTDAAGPSRVSLDIQSYAAETSSIPHANQVLALTWLLLLT